MLADGQALEPHHRRLLEQGSGISPEVIEQRGYWTAPTWQKLGGLGFRDTQHRPRSEER